MSITLNLFHVRFAYVVNGNMCEINQLLSTPVDISESDLEDLLKRNFEVVAGPFVKRLT